MTPDDATAKALEIVTQWARNPFTPQTRLIEALTEVIAIELQKASEDALSKEHHHNFVMCEKHRANKFFYDCVACINTLLAAMRSARTERDALQAEVRRPHKRVEEISAGTSWLIRALRSTAPSTWSGWGIVADLENALATPFQPDDEQKTFWMVERQLEGRAHWLSWRGRDQCTWVTEATQADHYDWEIAAHREARAIRQSQGVDCEATEHAWMDAAPRPPAQQYACGYGQNLGDDGLCILLLGHDGPHKMSGKIRPLSQPAPEGTQ